MFSFNIQLKTGTFGLNSSFITTLDYELPDVNVITRGVGQDAYLHCSTNISSNTVTWERLDGVELQDDSFTTNGVLMLPSVRRDSSGVYRCVVETLEGLQTSDIELRVTDFVPDFDGSSYLELPPMKDEQFANVQMDINFKPKTDDGLIIYSDRVGATGNVNNFHSGGVKEGKFVYTYDVGHGIEQLQSPNRVDLNEWNSVHIKNTDDKASLQLNNGDIVHRDHGLPNIVQFDAVSLDLGGTGNISDKYITGMDRHYKGAVGSVLVDGEPLDLSLGKRVGIVEFYDACQYRPCLNGGHCIPSNVGNGFICQCDSRFQGEFCEKKSHICGEEDCNSGFCLENPDEGTWNCVCPLGTRGVYCEQTEEEMPETISFSGESSFLSIPAPSQITNFTVSMKLVPQAPLKNNSMLLYLAASYNPNTKGYMNLALIDGQLAYTYKNGAGRNVIIAQTPITSGRENVVELIRIQDKTQIILNGELAKSSKTSSFQPGTDLFIGGLAPGIPKNPMVGQESFSGCISEIIVNGKPIDFKSTDSYSSGDIGKCLLEDIELTTTELIPTIPIYPADGDPTEPGLHEEEYESALTATSTETPDSEMEGGDGTSEYTVQPDEATDSGQQEEHGETEDDSQREVVIEQNKEGAGGSWLSDGEGGESTDEGEVEKTVGDTTETENGVGDGQGDTEIPTTEETPETIVDTVPDATVQSSDYEGYIEATTDIPYALPTDWLSKESGSQEVTTVPDRLPEVPEEEEGAVETPTTDETADVNQDDRRSEEDWYTTLETPYEPAIEQDDDYFTTTEPEEEEHLYEIRKDPEPPMIMEWTPPTSPPELYHQKSEVENTYGEKEYELPSEEEPEQVPPEEITTTRESWPTITETHPEMPPETVPPTEEPEPTEAEEVVDPLETWSTQLPYSGSEEHTPVDEQVEEEEKEEKEGEPTHTHIFHPDNHVDPCPGGRCPMPDLCANHTCGVNGVCTQHNHTHYECQCRIYYDGPQCDIFKPIEHAAKFDGDAFIEISGDDFPHLTSEKEEIIEFKIKTNSMHGILFWQGQTPNQPIVGEDYISIAIRDGFVYYSYELGGGAAEMVSKFRVDDGLEHKIRVERRGRDGALFVDDFAPVNGTSSGILAMLNVDGNVFVGGVPELSTMTGGMHHSNFRGCIADVILNGDKLDLMGSAIDGRNVRPCDEWVQPKRYLKSRSVFRWEFPQLNTRRNLEIRTRSRSRWGNRGLFF